MPNNKLQIWTEWVDTRSERCQQRQTLTKADIDTLVSIIRGESGGAKCHKLKGTKYPIISAYVNEERRLLLMPQGTRLMIVDILEKHNYETAHALRPGVAERFYQKTRAQLENQKDEWEEINAIENFIPTPDYQYEAPLPCISYHQQFITLDKHQNEAIRLKTPAVIIGDPGSGKSVMCSAMIREDIKNPLFYDGDQYIVYFSESSGLAKKMRTAWMLDHPIAAREAAVDRVIFANYADLLVQFWPEKCRGKQIIGREAFEHYMARRLSEKRWQEKYAFMSEPLFESKKQALYHEFQIITVCKSKEKYTSPEQSSNLPLHMREWAYEEHARYVKLISDEGKDIDPNLFLWEVEKKPFFRVYHDEALSASPAINLMLHRLTENANIVFFADPNQENTKEVTDLKYIVSELGGHCAPAEKFVLPTTYRLPPVIASFANTLLTIKQNINGGKNEKDQTSQVICMPEEHRHPGCLSWIPLENAQPLVEKLNDSNCVYTVITREEYLEEARQLFGPNNYLCTIEESRGQEFETVVLYRVTDPACPSGGKTHARRGRSLLERVSKEIAGLDQHLIPKLHQAKAKNVNRQFEPYLNSVYIAISRILHAGYLIEKGDPEKNELHKRLKAAIDHSMKDVVMDESFVTFNRESLIEKAKQDLYEGKVAQAKAACLKAGLSETAFQALMNAVEAEKECMIQQIIKDRREVLSSEVPLSAGDVKPTLEPDIALPLSKEEMLAITRILTSSSKEAFNKFMGKLGNLRKLLMPSPLHANDTILDSVMMDFALRQAFVAYVNRTKQRDSIFFSKINLDKPVYSASKKTSLNQVPLQEALKTTTEGMDFMVRIIKCQNDRMLESLDSAMPTSLKRNDPSDVILEGLSRASGTVIFSHFLNVLGKMSTAKKWLIKTHEDQHENELPLLVVLNTPSLRAQLIAIMEERKDSACLQARSNYIVLLNAIPVTRMITITKESGENVKIPLLFHMYSKYALIFMMLEVVRKAPIVNKEEYEAYTKQYWSNELNCHVNLVTLAGVVRRNILMEIIEHCPKLVTEVEWVKFFSFSNGESRAPILTITEGDEDSVKAVYTYLTRQPEFLQSIKCEGLFKEVDLPLKKNFSVFDYLLSYGSGRSYLSYFQTRILQSGEFSRAIADGFLDASPTYRENVNEKYLPLRHSRLFYLTLHVEFHPLLISYLDSIQDRAALFDKIIAVETTEINDIRQYTWSILSALASQKAMKLILLKLIKQFPEEMKSLPGTVWHAPVGKRNRAFLPIENYVLMHALIKTHDDRDVLSFFKHHYPDQYAQGLKTMGRSLLTPEEINDRDERKLSRSEFVNIPLMIKQNDVTVLEHVAFSRDHGYKLSRALNGWSIINGLTMTPIMFNHLCFRLLEMAKGGSFNKLLIFFEFVDLNEIVFPKNATRGARNGCPLLCHFLAHSTGRQVIYHLLQLDVSKMMRLVQYDTLSDKYRLDTSGKVKSVMEYLAGNDIQLFNTLCEAARTVFKLDQTMFFRQETTNGEGADSVLEILLSALCRERLSIQEVRYYANGLSIVLESAPEILETLSDHGHGSLTIERLKAVILSVFKTTVDTVVKLRLVAAVKPNKALYHDLISILTLDEEAMSAAYPDACRVDFAKVTYLADKYDAMLKMGWSSMLDDLLDEPQAVVILSQYLDNDKPLLVNIMEHNDFRSPLLERMIKRIESSDNTQYKKLFSWWGLSTLIEIDNQPSTMIFELLSDEMGIALIERLLVQGCIAIDRFNKEFMLTEGYSRVYQLHLTPFYLLSESPNAGSRLLSMIVNNQIEMVEQMTQSQLFQPVKHRDGSYRSVLSNLLSHAGPKKSKEAKGVMEALMVHYGNAFRNLGESVWLLSKIISYPGFESLTCYLDIILSHPDFCPLWIAVFSSNPSAITFDTLIEEVSIHQKVMPRLFHLAKTSSVIHELTGHIKVMKERHSDLHEISLSLYYALIKPLTGDVDSHTTTWSALSALLSNRYRQEFLIELLDQLPDLVNLLRFEDFQNPINSDYKNIALVKLIGTQAVHFNAIKSLIAKNFALSQGFREFEALCLSGVEQHVKALVIKQSQNPPSNQKKRTIQDKLDFLWCSYVIKYRLSITALDQPIRQNASVFSLGIGISAFREAFFDREKMNRDFDSWMLNCLKNLHLNYHTRDEEGRPCSVLIALINQTENYNPTKIIYLNPESPLYYKNKNIEYWCAPYTQSNTEKPESWLSHLDILISDSRLTGIAKLVMTNHFDDFKARLLCEQFLYQKMVTPNGTATRLAYMLADENLHIYVLLYLREPVLPIKRLVDVLLSPNPVMNAGSARMSVYTTLLSTAMGKKVVAQIEANTALNQELKERLQSNAQSMTTHGLFANTASGVGSNHHEINQPLTVMNIKK